MLILYRLSLANQAGYFLQVYNQPDKTITAIDDLTFGLRVGEVFLL